MSHGNWDWVIQFPIDSDMQLRPLIKIHRQSNKFGTQVHISELRPEF